MSDRDGMNRFNEILKDVAQMLLAKIKIDIKGAKWKYAFHDERAPLTGGGILGKFRVILQNGKLHDVKGGAPIEADMLLMEAWGMRDDLFPVKWYGLKIVIYPDGRCETVFNYDPECFNDPTFFES